MELHALQVFTTVVAERSFSRAAEKLFRTQPAISLAIQRLESELGAKLIDREMRGAKELVLTDAGQVVFEHARRFHNLEQELLSALAELHDKSAGRLIVGANEASTLYLLPHIERYRGRYPGIKVQVRRSQSSRIPAQLLEGDLELGVTSYDPGDDRLVTKVIYTDALAFIVSPQHRLANRRSVSIGELGKETFIAHNVLSPYRDVVLREFRRHKVPLNMDVEMPTLETIRRLVQNDEGVAFLPRMCVSHDVETGAVREVTVKELHVERKVRLLYSKARTRSRAARPVLELVLTPT
jgi:DNA-binding transcriptional LysR family regulator